MTGGFFLVKETIVILPNILVQATSLLQKNLENAKASLEVLVADLQFLRDQVTITQVIFVKIRTFLSGSGFTLVLASFSCNLHALCAL